MPEPVMPADPLTPEQVEDFMRKCYFHSSRTLRPEEGQQLCVSHELLRAERDDWKRLHALSEQSERQVIAHFEAELSSPSAQIAGMRREWRVEGPRSVFGAFMQTEENCRRYQSNYGGTLQSRLVSEWKAEELPAASGSRPTGEEKGNDNASGN